MASTDRSPFSDDFLADMRERLLRVRDEAASGCRDLGDLALQPSGQDGSFEQPADFGSEEYAKEINLELLAHESRLLVDLEDALARIDGRGALPYGQCEMCEDEQRKLCRSCPWIPKDRLRNSPWVRNCAQAQELLERETALREEAEQSRRS